MKQLSFGCTSVLTVSGADRDEGILIIIITLTLTSAQLQEISLTLQDWQ